MKKAFTLVELMIVVGIISFLIIMATIYLRLQLFKSNDARRKSEINRISIAVEEYEKDHDCYPQAVSCTNNTSLVPYLASIPCDPISKEPYYYEHEDSVCPGWYILYAKLQNPNDINYNANIGPLLEYSYYYASSDAPAIITQSDESSDTTSTDVPSGFYGCFSGICMSILEDPQRPGSLCDPHFEDSNCYSKCTNALGRPINQCKLVN